MKQILVIDDDASVAMIIRLWLEKRGDYRVITAGDGKAGLVAAQDENPDLILLDIDMPKMNGLDTLKRLNAKKSTRHIPVIMLTGEAAKEARDEATYEYADLYIVKPFEMSSLVSS